ncbi:hypothetical protein MAPG_10651 [Magnaporthiopsis poae ATCC 64411]|uniref:Pre-mRNA-splicing factor 38B n=1 Tax=Magnaporthiopsis poae (strain ATCC 64411 / 73-15) TaxID=644358 RepID=A0A0C4ED58_MAGP6|nr:hypothetical protein MAPG_10651 [Magnaporthiopsis poae ATCC 64411]
MMSHDFLLTDDAVAERLISEANDDPSRCPPAGLDSSRARPENKPKPNTRFLRNIIRTTNNHNAALQAKETAESQARLKELREAELRRRRTASPAPSSTRGISRHAVGHQKDDRSGGGGEVLRNERRSRDSQSDSRRRKGRDTSRSRDKDHRRHRHRSCSPDGGRSHRHQSRRERSPLRGDGGGEVRTHRHGSRHDRRARDSSRSKSPRDYGRKRLGDDEQEDSDTLDDVVGPLPPPPSRPTRGRGGTAQASGIDARFSESYDPTSDVAYLDFSAEVGSRARSGGSGGWDDVAEAFRDRRKWEAQGAERLRAAGFTDAEIQKWERGAGARPGGGGDADPDSFRWSKKGELRQWDRGKTINADGTVSTGPEWAKQSERP